MDVKSSGMRAISVFDDQLSPVGAIKIPALSQGREM
jgi:hypothetical protein